MKILLTLILIQLGAAIGQATESGTTRPNILFIFADDMGYGDSGFTGSTQVKTPHLDKLAREGVIFSQAYVTAPFCGPSRAGLLTGRYQQRFGFEFNPDYAPHLKPEWLGLPREEKTVGDRMQAISYHTAIGGKWNLGHHKVFYPTACGFDYFFGIRGGGHSYLPTLERKAQKGYWYPNFGLERMGTELKEIETPYLTGWFTDDALNHLDHRAQGDKPWLLYLSYNCPHGPAEAKKEDIRKYSQIDDPIRRTYCAILDNLDQNVGRLIQKLKESESV